MLHSVKNMDPTRGTRHPCIWRGKHTKPRDPLPQSLCIQRLVCSQSWVGCNKVTMVFVHRLRFGFRHLEKQSKQSEKAILPTLMKPVRPVEVHTWQGRSWQKEISNNQKKPSNQQQHQWKNTLKTNNSNEKRSCNQQQHHQHLAGPLMKLFSARRSNPLLFLQHWARSLPNDWKLYKEKNDVVIFKPLLPFPFLLNVQCVHPFVFWQLLWQSWALSAGLGFRPGQEEDEKE